MSNLKSTAVPEEAYQTAKSTLVSSLVELSTAATQTATAALNFYKFAGTSGADAATASASLKTLSDTVLAAANAASSSLANGSNVSAPEPKRTIAKPQKKKDSAPASAALVPELGAASLPSSAPSESTADTTVSSDAVTDPALLKPSPEKPKKKRAEKDPNAPKKPVTSYLRFNLAERQRLKKERGENGQPTLQATELNQIIADRWATLDEAAKLELQRAYEADYEVYKKNVEDYKTKKITELASAAQDAQSVSSLDPVFEPATPNAAAPKSTAAKPSVAKPAAPKVAVAKPAAPKPVVATPAAPSMTEPSASTVLSPAEKPKKKKKASKKTADLSEAELLALATETAKAAIAAEEVQAQIKPTKKRKDKDASEKSSKKKKTAEHQV